MKIVRSLMLMEYFCIVIQTKRCAALNWTHDKKFFIKLKKVGEKK